MTQISSAWATVESRWAITIVVRPSQRVWSAFWIACSDSESEQAIQKALRTLCEGRTTIVIAHRLSTVAQADEICVLDRGRIVERGRHGELLAMGHTYTHIAQTQFPRDAA